MKLVVKHEVLQAMVGFTLGSDVDQVAMSFEYVLWYNVHGDR